MTAAIQMPGVGLPEFVGGNDGPVCERLVPEGLEARGLRPLSKRCGLCGFTYDRAAWEALPLEGVQTIPGDDLYEDEHYEQRTCSHCVPRGHAIPSTLLVLIEVFVLRNPLPITDRGECALCLGERAYQDRRGASFITVACANH